MEKLQQRLLRGKLHGNDAPEYSDDEEQELSEQIKDLKVVGVDEKKRRSNTELQVHVQQAGFRHSREKKALS